MRAHIFSVSPISPACAFRSIAKPSNSPTLNPRALSPWRTGSPDWRPTFSCSLSLSLTPCFSLSLFCSRQCTPTYSTYSHSSFSHPLFSFIISSYPCRSLFLSPSSTTDRPHVPFSFPFHVPSLPRSAYDRQFIDSRGRIYLLADAIPSRPHYAFCLPHSAALVGVRCVSVCARALPT